MAVSAYPAEWQWSVKIHYVKSGPAEVDGNRLVLTSVPPGARFPVKVTVVAWQYGIPGSVQTAAPVEREFYIVRK